MWKNQLKTILMLGALSAVLVGVGSLIGPGWAWIMLAVSLAMNLGAYFFSDKIVMRMHGARELAPGELPRLRAMTEELARAANIPTPRLYVMPDAMPNAFATGRNPQHGAVAVTEGIMEILSERELRGVIAHEIAHIKNRDILVATIAAGVASAVAWLANMLSFQWLLGGNDEEDGSPLAALAAAIVAPIAVTLIQLAISRSREYLADATGAKLAGDPEALASALERLEDAAHARAGLAAPVPATASLFIVSPLAGSQGLVALFSTHPPIAERARRLRAMTRSLSNRISLTLERA